MPTTMMAAIATLFVVEPPELTSLMDSLLDQLAKSCFLFERPYPLIRSKIAINLSLPPAGGRQST